MPTVTLQQSTIDDLLKALGAVQSADAPSPPVQQPPRFVVPAQVASWPHIISPLAWANGQRVFSGSGFVPGVVWILPFRTGAGWTGGILAAAEYQAPPAPRNIVLLRNSDGESVFSNTSGSQQTASINFTSGVPPRMSGKVHLDFDTDYTLAIWDTGDSVSPSNMIAQLTFS